MNLFDKETVTMEFLPSESNRLAYDYIKSTNWPHFAVIIIGGEGVGKSFLSENEDYSEFANLHLLESEEDELELFNIYNELKNMNGQRLIITSQKHPQEMNFVLPDLKTRLAECPVIKIESPDDELIRQYIVMQFSARQLAVSSDIVEYIVKRVERDFYSINELIERLDSAAMKDSRKITIPLVKQIIEE